MNQDVDKKAAAMPNRGGTGRLSPPQTAALRRIKQDAKLFGGEVCEAHVHALVLRGLVERGLVTRHRPAGQIARRTPTLGLALRLTDAGRAALSEAENG